MNDSTLFYQNLPSLDSFAESLDPVHHRDVPADWWVAVTDVVDSTAAIDGGKYKDVNTAGALSAMAIANINKDLDFPFVFGGDGIICLIPSNVKEAVHDILLDTRQKVKQYFDLDLRVGLISVAELAAEGFPIKMAKLKVSDYYNQAILSGSGLQEAESRIKKPGSSNPYIIQSFKGISHRANFDGFTCRWKDIPSKRGETISVIVQLRGETIASKADQLSELLGAINRNFGSEQDHHPLHMELMEMGGNGSLEREAKIFTGRKSGWLYWKTLLIFRLQVIIMRLALSLNLPARLWWYELPKLKEYQRQSSDVKKFDGSFKFVLDASTECRQSFEKFLQNMEQEGRIFYGLHVSDRAVMTCLLHEGSRREVHFIDAADGGYALASRKLKIQVAAAGLDN